MLSISRQVLVPLAVCFCIRSTSVTAQTYIYNQTSIATGNQPSAFIVTDLNGDGQPDVAVVNQADGTLSVTLSRSDGSFSSVSNYPVGNGPVALVAADFNGDLIPDIAVVNQTDNTVSVLLGKGDGTFGAAQTYDTGGQPSGIVAADWNGDGKADLAVINQGDDTVSILYGNGDGSFRAGSTVSVPATPVAIVTGDFNNDGLSDIAVGSSVGAITLLLDSSSGSFSSKTQSLSASLAGLAVGDWNRDGNLDLVATSADAGQVTVLLGTGLGSFQPVSTYLFSPNGLLMSPGAVAAADFNHDGNLDIAVSISQPTAEVLILPGKGDGTFQSQEIVNTPFPAPSLMATADFNNDNYPDLAFADPSRIGVGIALNDGSGGFEDNTAIALPFSPGIVGAVTGDILGNGKTDIVTAEFDQDFPSDTYVNEFLSLVPGNGDGTFQPAIQSSQSGIGIHQVVKGDFNGDGLPDIATWGPLKGGSLTEQVFVALNTGDGSFAAPVAQTISTDGGVQNIIAGDFNHDGKDDLVIESRTSDQGGDIATLLLSNGDGTFRSLQVMQTVGTAGGFLAAADFNHDGNLDLAWNLMAGPGAPSQLLAFLGHGDGTFLASVSYSTGSTSYPESVLAADFNHDGNADLLLQGTSGLEFFAGNGDGTFQNPKISPLSIPFTYPIAADFNGDGKLDIAESSGASWADVLLGNGDGTFKPPVYLAANLFNSGIAAGEFNQDDASDLVLLFTNGLIDPNNDWEYTFFSTPSPTFSRSMLVFAPQMVGTTSSSQSLLFNNQGNSPLNLSSITTTGPFGETNNCPAKLNVGQGCTVEVQFTPIGNGNAPGQLVLTDNAGPGQQAIDLSGWAGAADFYMDSSPALVSVQAGFPAHFVVRLGSGGGYSGTVQLLCSGAPAKAACSLSQSSVLVNGSTEESLEVTITTTPATVGRGASPGTYPGSPFSNLPFDLCAMLPLGSIYGFRRRRAAAMLGMLLLMIGLVSCGGGGGSGSTGGGGGSVSGTPSGNYSITVTGTGGTLTHSVSLKLTVQ